MVRFVTVTVEVTSMVDAAMLLSAVVFEPEARVLDVLV